MCVVFGLGFSICSLFILFFFISVNFSYFSKGHFCVLFILCVLFSSSLCLACRVLCIRLNSCFFLSLVEFSLCLLVSIRLLLSLCSAWFPFLTVGWKYWVCIVFKCLSLTWIIIEFLVPAALFFALMKLIKFMFAFHLLPPACCFLHLQSHIVTFWAADTKTDLEYCLSLHFKQSLKTYPCNKKHVYIANYSF